MNIRRPAAALFVSLALLGGPATLTACGGDPSGLNRNDGDSSDNETGGNTSGGDPGGVSQGNVPRNDSNEVDPTDNEDRNEDSNPDSGG
jgi:hypothetical protein